MAALGDRHSRIVFWLKILLPLTALAILSTMFLVARTVVTEGTVPFSGVDVQGLARDQRLNLPEYSAVTADGASVTVRATTARPGLKTTAATAENVTAVYVTGAGRTVTLTSPTASLNGETHRLLLEGDVRAVTSADYHLSSPRIEAALDRTAFLADGPVVATAPYGRIEAGQVTYGPTDGTGPPDVLVFNRGVRLVYVPQP